MGDDDPAPEERASPLLWLASAGILALWFAMLWFMFGDVL